MRFVVVALCCSFAPVAVSLSLTSPPRLGTHHGVGPLRASPLEQTRPDPPATTPQFSGDQPSIAAAQFGVALAADDGALFRKNPFSPLNDVELCVLENFERMEWTWFNTYVKVLTLLQKPRFRFGMYDYNECILEQKYQYATVGYVDEQQHLVWWHPDFENVDDADYVLVNIVTTPDDGKATPGSIWKWSVEGTGKSAYIGKFAVTVKVVQ